MRIGGRLVGAALLAAGLLSVGARAYLRRALPPRHATLIADGLRGRVEIRRDRWGVPHIYAADVGDALFGLGLVHAQDRLWQLELGRRAATGSLSELFGARTLEVDRFVRRLGFARVAAAELAQLPDESRRALDRYTAGINYHLEAASRRLPVEFAIVRHRPARWRGVDTLAFTKLVGWTLSFAWDAELIRAALVRRLPPEVVAALEPTYEAGGPLAVPPGAPSEGERDPLDPDALAWVRSSLPVSGPRRTAGAGGAGGSNAWAVRGEHTATGTPLLASDPHLRQGIPGTWYEAHLVADDLNVIGATMPGMPGVVIGHNGQVAWGITAALTDTQDLFAERISPSDPDLYAVGDDWRRAEVVQERIGVRGAEPVVERVRVTRHGPILVDEAPDPDGGEPTPAFAVSCPILEPGESIGPALAINRARDWDSFRAGVAQLNSLPANFVYADRAGNVGYQLVGAHPDRPARAGMLPQAGWPADAGWTGRRPFEALPSAFNPPGGMVASANNRPTDPDELGHEYHAAARVARIWALLRERTPHSIASFRRIQLDTLNLGAAPVLARAREIVARHDPEKAALARLLAWDGRVEAESAGAAIYELLTYHLLRQLARDVAGPDADLLLGASINPLTPTNPRSWLAPSLLVRGLAEPDWLGRVVRRPGESWDDRFAAAFRAAVGELRQRLGDDVDAWRWGRLHRITLAHPFGEIPGLGRFFNRGPFPISGDGETIVQTQTSLLDPARPPAWIPSYRQIVDLGDVDNSVAMHLPGQSGLPGSPHYDDLIAPFLAGEYHPMLYARGLVERETVGVIELVPPPS